MKKNLIFSIVIYALLIVGVMFVNSYVQALSKQEKLQIEKEILEQEINNNKINQEEAIQIYKNMEERVTECDICEQYHNCPIHEQNNYCIERNNQCSKRNYHCSKDYSRGRCHR